MTSQDDAGNNDDGTSSDGNDDEIEVESGSNDEPSE